MAADAVNEAVRSLDARVPDVLHRPRPAGRRGGFLGLWNQRQRLAAESGLHVARIEHLLHRYGSTDRRAAGARREQTRRWPIRYPARRLPAGRGAVRGHPRGRPAPGRHPGPPHPDLDRVVGSRRGVRRDRGPLMAVPLGWDEAQLQREVAHYRTRVAAERESQNQRDDATADAARLGAPDIVRTG